MTRRFVRFTPVIALLAVALATPTDAETTQLKPSANGPFVLSFPERKPEVKSDATPDVEASAEPEVIRPPLDLANESKPLGAPTPPPATEAEAEVAEEAAPFWSGWMAGSGGEFLRVGGALAVVVGLILLLKAIATKSPLGRAVVARPSGVLGVLARYPLSRGQSLLIVKLGRRLLLLHQTSTSLTPLTEVVEPNEVAALLGKLESGSSQKHAPQFQKVLQQFESEQQRSTDSAAAGEPVERGEIIDLTVRPRGERNPWLLARRTAS